MIKSLPIEENPREKAILNGIDSLSNVEILALLLRTGNKNESVIELATRLLEEIDGIEHLLTIDYGTLISIKGIKKAKAITLMAAIELNRRMMTTSKVTFNDSLDVYRYLSPKMAHLTQETFVVLILDQKHRLIRMKTVFIGSINTTFISVREIYQQALTINGAAIICAHNHPSGNASPSKEDEAFTEQLLVAGKMIGIECLDHIIVGQNQYYSFMAKRLIDE